MDHLRGRGNIIMVFVGLVLLVYGVRLFHIQVINNEYKGRAERLSVKTKIIVPPRGNIYNRYNEIYVSNSPIFDLLVVPQDLEIPDTLLLEKYLEMSGEDLSSGITKAREHSPVKEYILARYIEPEAYAALQEEIWDFKGVSFNPGIKRFYRFPVGGNFLGYISEVDTGDINQSNGYYQIGDLKGKLGIERYYEELLRGRKGQKVVLKDVHNREVGSYAGGSMDKSAQKGPDIMLGIDTRLQALGEELMQNKKGSIVAIEPSSGEILAFVSAPSYDPNDLTGRELRKNWRKLRNDTLNPLYNRPLMATYPPGSIFKLAVALAALSEGTATEETYYGCGGGFKRNRGKPGCRFHPSPLNLKGAIQYSCNSYFAATYWDFLQHKQYDDIYESYDKWYTYMAALGVGQKLNIDIPYEKSGLLPTAAMYDDEKRWYGHNRWKASTIISNAIGQGEILMTPLQMANMVTIIANRGYYKQPHFVKAIRDTENPKQWDWQDFPSAYSGIAAKHFETVIDAMDKVVSEGTGRRAYLSDIVVCGKTGTVQNPHGDDHATFIAFAPRDNPQIAVAVVIENAKGGGGRWAAPTASVLIEQYLKGKVEEKEFEYNRLKGTNFINPQ